MKKTSFMSNSDEILSELTDKCDEQHRHQHLLGSRARPAARYPEGLCRAICMGLVKGLCNKECHVKKILELTEHTTMGEIPEEETVDFDVEAWEDEAVRQARLKEMQYVKEKEVWRHQQRRRGHAELPESVIGEGVQRRRGRGAIRQHAAAGGVEFPVV